MLIRVPFVQVVDRLAAVFVALGFSDERARTSARLFAEASLEGVPSHGLNRVSRFVRQVRAGVVDPRAEAEPVERLGAWERWNGRHGAGNLNARACTTRAMELAAAHGIGCVGLAETNHWMRGGTYGWQAATAGYALIAWTNTMPNMPPWGARDHAVGNNPLVIAVPRADGPVVVDMAMSQFSYGRLEGFAREGTATPVPAGWGAAGQLTANAAEVLESGRVLPVGFWKGSALAVALDLLAVACSGGNSTRDVPREVDLEASLSQTFIAIDVGRSKDAAGAAQRIAAVVEELVALPPLDPASPVRYPGQRVLEVRRTNLDQGVPVDAEVWDGICAWPTSR